MSRAALASTISAVLALAPSVEAQPKNACAEAGERGEKIKLETDGGSPVRATLCFVGDACYAYAPNASPVAVAKSGGLPMYKRAVEVRDDHGHLAICTGQTCDPLGPKLAAAIAAAKKDNEGCGRCDPRPGPLLLDGTTDRKVVTIANGRGEPAWNVAADAPIAFTAPTGHGHTREGGVSVVGTVLAVGWYLCPRMTGDYCDTQETVATTFASATGKTVGSGVHDDFSVVYRMSGDRYVLAGGDSGTFQLVDNGVPGPAITLPWKHPWYPYIEQLDDDRLAILYGTDRGYRLIEITAAAKSLTQRELTKLPLCSP